MTEKVKRTRNKPAIQPTGKREYSVNEKIQAVTALKAVGGSMPYSNRAIAAAQQQLGVKVAVSTLHRWLAEYGQQVEALLPVPADMQTTVAETHTAVLQDFVSVRGKALDHLLNSDAMGKASARDAAVVAGIAQDHIGKMVGLPAEAQQIMKAFMQLCTRFSLDYHAVLDDYMHAIRQQYEPPSIDVTALTTLPR